MATKTKPVPKRKLKVTRAAAPKDTTATASHRNGWEIWGLLLVAIVIVTFISLISEFVRGGQQNLLGPYLGHFWASVVSRSAGSLPSLVLLSGLTVLGLKLMQNEGGPLRWRHPVTLLGCFVFLSMLLSVRNIGASAGPLSANQFQMTGGYIGNFLVQRALVPVFGPTQFGPYLLSGFGLMFTLVWGFKWSISATIEKLVELMGIFIYPIFDALDRLRARRAQARREAEERAQLAGLPTPAEIIAPRKPRQPGEVPYDIQEIPEYRGGKRRKMTPVAADLTNSENGTPDTEDLSPTVSDEPGITEYDPLEVRRRRDLDLERKRISELNDWELQQRKLEIGGMLSAQDGRPQVLPDEARNRLLAANPELAELQGGRGDTQEEIFIGEASPGSDRAASPIDTDAEEELSPEEAIELKRKSFDQKLKALKAERQAEEDEKRRVEEKPSVPYVDYVIPDMDQLFEEPPEQAVPFTEEELRVQSKHLEDQLRNFKVMGKVTQICPGPVITRFEVELAPGVKVSRISNLEDDLALAMRAKRIRILAPIPGKSVVGIEVPNRKPQVVFIKEILQSKEFEPDADNLPIALGKTIGGEPFVTDLTRAPHLLIAGQTGSGKSVCINSIMASFLTAKTPDQVRLLLVDPKVVELKPYDSIPHLLYPVITQPDVAVAALKWATVEMDRRYEVLAIAAVRNIKGFNQKIREGKLDDKMPEEDRIHMHYIVIIIDELADLMMVAGKEVETSIARIAQKARAVGIHLILATQRPSTNVITGTIKANLPTRIAFQVASQIDARTIMDKAGAEQLLGRGDMLFRPIDQPEPIRLHGAFLDDDQAESMAAACADQHVNYPQIETFNLEEDPDSLAADDEPRDAKFRDAAELVVQIKQASVSLLQRRLGIGYARAGRLVDQLERAGIVGRERGSKPREVLMDEMELLSFLSGASFEE